MIDYEKALEEALETPENAEQDAKEKKFVIDTAEKAEWATKKIAKIKAEQAKINAMVDERIKKLNAWRDEQLKPLVNDISYFEVILRPYAEEVIAAQRKKKSFVLPNGAKISISKGKADMKKTDDDIFKQYLVDNGYSDYLETKTTTTAKWGEFKKACKIVDGQVISPDGEVMECVVVSYGEDKFSVDTDGIELEGK